MMKSGDAAIAGGICARPGWASNPGQCQGAGTPRVWATDPQRSSCDDRRQARDGGARELNYPALLKTGKLLKN